MTREQLSVMLDAYVRNLQTPRILAELAGVLKALGDAQSVKSSRVAMAASTGSLTDRDALVELFDAIGDYVAESAPSALNWGMVTLSFAGGVANEAQSSTVTGETWVVDSTTTPVIAFYTGGARSSDVNAYNFNWAIDTFTAGSGFQITATTPSSGGVIAGDYDVLWIGLS